MFQIFLCRTLLLCNKQEWNWNTHVQICYQNQSQIHVPILYLCLYTPFYNAVLSTFTYYLWMLLMNILHIKKNEKGSNLAQKILSLCALWVFVCKGHNKYICQFGTTCTYLLNNKTMNKQYLCHIIIIIIISRYNKINKINYILINKINHHKINVVELKF